MKFIRDFMDKIEPDKKTSPFLHTLWDGADTFLYAPATVTQKGTHIKDSMDLKRTMIHVVIAMQIAFIAGMVNIGHQHYTALGMYPGLVDGILYKLAYGVLQYLPAIIVVHVVGLGIEFLFASKKGHAIEEGFLVSGFLIPLIMPPNVPLWILALATAFAVVIAKEAFGGTGMNILNVALVARVFVFFAYPSEISGDEVWVAYEYNMLHQLVGLKAHTVDFLATHGIDYAALFNAKGVFQTDANLLIDGWSGATPLALAAKGGWAEVQNASYVVQGVEYQQYSIFNLIFGNIPGSVGEMNKLGILAGIAILIGSGIGSWRVMLSFALGAAVMGILLNIIFALMYSEFNVLATEILTGNFNIADLVAQIELHNLQNPDNLVQLTNPFLSVPWFYQFLMGGMLFAMAFMATDPVTAAQTLKGKWVYGFMIGVVGMIIRVLNPAYPEGWMLAIIFMNVFAPLIDHVIYQQNIKRRLERA